MKNGIRKQHKIQNILCSKIHLHIFVNEIFTKNMFCEKSDCYKIKIIYIYNS